VVGADELLAGELVEALGEPLASRRLLVKTIVLVWPDQLEDPRVDRRPDAASAVAAADAGRRLLSWRQDLAERGHVVDRDDDLELERLAAPASTIVTSRSGPTRRGTGRSCRAAAGWRAGRCAAGGRRSSGREALEALEAQGQVGAALGAGDGVDLVDDDVLDAAEDLAGLARQQEVEALGVVMRMSGGGGRSRGGLLRRVAGAAGDGDVGGCSPSRWAARPIPVSGARRLRSTS
jgi:hypothetical protein